MGKREEAEALFLDGANCAQAVLCAFEKEVGLEHKTAMMLASSFGGGMGRMREVCGAVSGMFMVAGLLYGYDENSPKEAKAEHYELIRNLADQFRAKTGSILCRELLDKKAIVGGLPEERTPEYYKSRPCAYLVGLAAEITENLIKD
jgi:C_GCAxxG_C_C family probable redox protein